MGLELTGDVVISAIAVNIRNAFTTAEIAKLYKDTPMQNISKPYAFLHQINADHVNGLKEKGRWTFLVDVRVHPKDDQTDVHTWGRTVATKLVDTLNVITISNQYVKSSSMEWRVEEGVLHFIVGYSFGVVKVLAQTPSMNELLINATKILPPDIITLGEYVEGFMIDVITGQTQVNGELIDGDLVDMSLITANPMVEDKLKNGDVIIFLKLGTTYLATAVKLTI